MSSSPSYVVRTTILAWGCSLRMAEIACEAAHATELEIHQRHVWSKATEKSDGLFPLCGHADHLHIRLSVDDQGNSFTDNPVIVDTEDANARALTSRF